MNTSVFKMLLTGVDDSALAITQHATRKNKAAALSLTCSPGPRTGDPPNDLEAKRERLGDSPRSQGALLRDPATSAKGARRTATTVRGTHMRYYLF